VVYVNQWQRDLPSPEFIHFLDGITPEYVVRINGADYVRVYHDLYKQSPLASQLLTTPLISHPESAR
jgi:hypothetical protein